MGESDDEDRPPEWASGPNAVCYTCGGLRKVTQPRLYVIQVTEDMQTGMTMNEFRTCPQCDGRGWLPGLVPPV